MSAPTINRIDLPASEPDDRTFGHLVADLLEQLPELIRAELRLAQAEVTQKGKNLGVGAGLLSASGIVALFGLGAAIATGIIGLAQVLPAWAAAACVTGGLLVLAALLGLIGSIRVRRGTPPVPDKAIAGVHEDLAVLAEVKP